MMKKMLLACLCLLFITSCRQEEDSGFYTRGKIYDRNGVLLVDNAENATPEHPIRTYYTKSATHILGSVGQSKGWFTGEFGIEEQYDWVYLGITSDVTLTIDKQLQEYADSLMIGKTGAVVAIDPQTGEILCMVSTPSYDPSYMVDSMRNVYFPILKEDPGKPFFNRAISGCYPPGSTFKSAQALVALQDSAITAGTVFPCNGGYRRKGWRLGCYDDNASWNLKMALATSCNGYFCHCFHRFLSNPRYENRNQAMDRWYDLMSSMGFGKKLGIDIQGEKAGFLPNSNYVCKTTGSDNWDTKDICSESIGQGSILATPLQIANLAATIANRGFYYRPHLAKKAGQDTCNLEKVYTKINPDHYSAVIEGMRAAATDGTLRYRGNLDAENIIVCGETGIAQNPFGRDHSVFMGFAPMDNPKIAICCYVENGGLGNIYGVPIGTLIIEKYLNGKISDRRKQLENPMLDLYSWESLLLLFETKHNSNN